jgi:hypothetical protein
MASTNAPAPTEAPKMEGLKLPDPMPISGVFKDDKVDASAWLTLMHRHLLLRDIAVNSAKAVYYCALFLRGPALTWSQTVELPKKFSEFADLLKATFQPIESLTLARERLKALYQSSSVAGYADAFRKAALLCTTMSDEDKVDLFIDNLKPYLAKEVRVHLIGKPKDDLELAVRTAVIIEHECRKEFARKDASKSSMPVVGNSISFRKSHQAQSNDHHQQSSAVRKCYTCGATDHMANKCPKSNKNPKPHKSGSSNSAAAGSSTVKPAAGKTATAKSVSSN